MEKRKNVRVPFQVTLKIKELYKQDNVKIEDITEEIEVFNLSKSGLGFVCNHELPLDFYFNAKITIDNERFFYTVAKIIRADKNSEQEFVYGCEFVGLADVLSGVVDEYVDEEKKG